MEKRMDDGSKQKTVNYTMCQCSTCIHIHVHIYSQQQASKWYLVEFVSVPEHACS